MQHNIKFQRFWSMPNHETFKIKPIKDLIYKELGLNYVDPFPYPFKKDAIEYLKSFPASSESKYENAGISLDKKYNASYWSNCKKEISRIIKPNGKVISFGWNSNGIGKKYGFSITKIVLIAHGSIHNDTIATIEIKNATEV